jgi:hypothetical protein
MSACESQFTETPQVNLAGDRRTGLAAILRHPYALVLTALATDATAYVGSVGSMLEVVTTGCPFGRTGIRES